MTIKKKRRDAKAEVRTWLGTGGKGTVRDIAHALDMPDVSVYSALVRLEADGEAVRKRGAVRAKDQLGRAAPILSDQWMGAGDEDAEVARRGNMSMVQSALASLPAGLPRWLGGRGVAS